MAAEAGKYRHVAFALGDISLLDINQLMYEKHFGALKDIIGLQTELNIETMTFYLLSERTSKNTEHYERLVRNMKRFFDEIAESSHIINNKIILFLYPAVFWSFSFFASDNSPWALAISRSAVSICRLMRS